MNFVNKMEKNVAKYLYPNEKMVVLVWMIDVVIQSAWVLSRINKDKGNESLLLLAFWRHVVNAIFWNIQRKVDDPWAI